MKKLTFLAVAAIMILTVSCQKEAEQTDKQTVNSEEKAPCNVPQSAEMRTASLGRTLAIYGYENESPEALIEAANILLTVKTVNLDATPVVKDKDNNPLNESSDNAEPTRSFAPADLLAAAKALAGEDANLLTLIQNTEAKIAAAAAADRGSYYGERSLDKCISSNNYHEYEITFNAGELAICMISGDGSTDLDLYICDSDMNLIAEDVDYTDQCYCSWTPTEDAVYVIRIYNRGDKKNNYTLYVN